MLCVPRTSLLPIVNYAKFVFGVLPGQLANATSFLSQQVSGWPKHPLRAFSHSPDFKNVSLTPRMQIATLNTRQEIERTVNTAIAHR